jgi:small-conductance mechanosensitive channel
VSNPFSNPEIFANPIWGIIWAIGIFVFSLFMAWLVFYIASFIKRRLLDKNPDGAVYVVVNGAVQPLIFLIVVEGIVISLLFVPGIESWHTYLVDASVSAIIAVVTYGIARTVGMLLNWQLVKTKGRKKQLDIGVALFLKRTAGLSIYVIGVLTLLAYLGISISPIIAGLGIGGLAVALALQPTLSNFFASIQILSDRVAHVGDYVEIGDNIAGYVVDIGWRSTRIRTPYNNTVIVPNSKFAESLVTNYNAPNVAVAVMLYCGVSYDSNLRRVKDITLEVANQVRMELDEAVKSFDPSVAFERFDDSNVTFWIWIQARDRISSFKLKSELIMQLHARFEKENIVINYPVRTTYLKWPEGIPPTGISAPEGKSG